MSPSVPDSIRIRGTALETCLHQFVVNYPRRGRCGLCADSEPRAPPAIFESTLNLESPDPPQPLPRLPLSSGHAGVTSMDARLPRLKFRTISTRTSTTVRLLYTRTGCTPFCARFHFFEWRGSMGQLSPCSSSLCSHSSQPLHSAAHKLRSLASKRQGRKQSRLSWECLWSIPFVRRA